jgi:hypothetical protein
MKNTLRLAGCALTAAITLSACGLAPTKSDNKMIGVVTTSAIANDDAPQGVSYPRRATFALADGDKATSSLDLYEAIRRCDPGRNVCHSGVAKLTSSVFIASISPNSALVDVSATFDVGPREGVSAAGLRQADSIAQAALKAHKDFRAAMALEYGKPKTITFDYGATLTVCLSRLDRFQMPLDKTCNPLVEAAH